MSDAHRGGLNCACPVCTRLKEVDEQLRKVKMLLDNLSRTRQLFATQIDCTHNRDLFRRLPNEILGYIFEECGPSNALRVALVCRRWRGVAHSTSRLWTTIDIRLVSPSTSLDATIMYTREWLTRSGQQPLTIRVTSSPMNVFPPGSGIGTLLKLINECAHRWYDLQLRIPPDVLQEIKSDPQGRSILRNLLIIPPGPSGTHGGFLPQNARLCPTVVHIEYPFRFLDIEWNNVTQVEVNFSIDECLEMLRRAPKITVCKLTQVFVNPSPSYPYPNHRIVRANLQSLSVCAYGSVPLLFRYISFPSLREVRYDFLDRALPQDEEFIAFFARSSSYLNILYLKALAMHESSILRILRNTNTLTDLELQTYGPVHNYLFQLLADSSLVIGNISFKFLPSLRSFKYRCSAFRSWDFLSRIFGPLSEIGNPNRRPLSKVSFLYLPSTSTDVEANIEETAVFQMLELQHRGIQLEVFCGDRDMLKSSLQAYRLLPA